MNRSSPAVEEVVEYCRIQAGLLFGSVETMTEEADALLDDIDDEMADIRSRLGRPADETDGPTGPNSTDSPGNDAVDVGSVERHEARLEERQAEVEATETRIRLFQRLASGYTELAEDLREGENDPQDALERVVRFEAEHDAPAYFDDRETLYEVVERGSDDG
ncbi:hypothetical protein ACFPYI_12505 [Halomarina salina]|uniref:Uncharacterized protein n=1 Tax=Halomarina salina TaxID=1872699 RepID=A0ABD5RNS1_9EURY|nr:hypothetical protein [Halomarina salina]